MPKIIFIEHDGQQHPVEADVGQTVMQAAVANLVPGIIAYCGGNCSCATCHVYVGDAWRKRMPPPSEMERFTVQCAMHPRESSRLSCQITITPDLDGLVLQLPESQS